MKLQLYGKLATLEMFLSDRCEVYFSEQDHEIDHKIQTATEDQ